MTRKDRLIAFYDAFGKGEVEKLDSIIRKDWTSFDVKPGQNNGRDGFKEFIPMVHQSIKELDWKIEEMIEEGDKIAVRSTFSGIHAGPILGAESSGKNFSIKAIDMHYFDENGMVYKTYHLEDWIAFLAQVGALAR